MKISPTPLICSLVAALALLAAQHQSLAGSATWSQTPVSNDWNTAENWVPNTVPNGPSDVASFRPSSITGVNISTTVEVSSVQFRPGAPPFTIDVEGVGINLFITGDGIVNGSGITQSFTDGDQAAIFFSNATAGDMTFFGGERDLFFFTGSSSAGGATFVVTSGGIIQGQVLFFDNSTASDATIQVSDFAIASFGDTTTAANAVFTATDGGAVLFGTTSTAANGVFTCSNSGETGFTQSATADHGHFTASGAATSSDLGGIINFSDDTTAAEADFVLNGGAAAGGSRGGHDLFRERQRRQCQCNGKRWIRGRRRRGDLFPKQLGWRDGKPRALRQ